MYIFSCFYKERGFHHEIIQVRRLPLGVQGGNSWEERGRGEREQIFTTSRKLYVFIPMGRKNLPVSFLSPALQNCEGDIFTSKKRNLVTLKENNCCFLRTVKKEVVMLKLLAVISIQKSRQIG